MYLTPQLKVRWYDGKSTIKDRTERDRWQLIRDLSKEEKNEVASSIENQERWQRRTEERDDIAFTKVIKFGRVESAGIFQIRGGGDESVGEGCHAQI